jgi:hypothetical protein
LRHERSCCHNRGPWWEILILQRWEIRIPHIDGKYGRAGACLCLLCGSSSPLRKWEGLKSGLPLASTPPQSLKCEKASKTTWPMIKTSFGKARPPFHNEWIVPLINYNWSSFRVKREVPHQRQFLTRVIDLHWLIFACERPCFKWERLKSVEVWVGPPNFKPSSFQFIFLPSIKDRIVPQSQMFLRISVYILWSHTYSFTYLCMFVLCVRTISIRRIA